MGSSSDLSTIETWAFRPAYETSWIPESFARDTDALSKALYKSISDGIDVSTSSGLFYDLPKSETVSSQDQGQSVWSSGGSDPEMAESKRVSRNPAPPSGKIAKRTSRVSKRSPTTFITADPSNFRQMVQQVTGVRFGTGQVPVGPVLKPDPQRPVGGVNRLQAGHHLPTLDTSAFWLDHHQAANGVGQSSLGFGPPSVVAEGGAAAGLDFDGFSNFPTLDSWKVM